MTRGADEGCQSRAFSASMEAVVSMPALMAG